ncbi:MAG: cation-translocating P-type ATPase [Gemmatimonadota bacterium]
MPDWHAIPVSVVLERLGSTNAGLTSEEATARFRKHGPNTLAVIEPISAWRILIAQVRSVVVVLLFVAMAVALAFGEVPEAIAIGAVLALNTALGFFTELRARRAMEALLELDVPGARVLRDGEPTEIDARELVPGDVIRLGEGDSVPADARLIETAELQVNEAPLTGESLPVAKEADLVLDADEPLPERRNMAYKATAVAAGSASAVIVATGPVTQVGRIGLLVGEIPDEKTPLEHRLDALGRRLVWITLVVAALVTGVGVLQGAELFRMVETGIALAIAAVPEGLPAVATIALAVGLRRMARRAALIRRLPAVEALGSTTVVCTDKTGTLTAGQMAVTRLWAGDHEVRIEGHGYEPTGEFRDEDGSTSPAEDPVLALALKVGLLAGRADVVRGPEGDWQVQGDPTEAALVVAARRAGLDRRALLEEWPNEGEVPFSSARRLMATFHRTDEGLMACVKGAPERILELSTRTLCGADARPLGEDEREKLSRRNEQYAAAGLRVLALATKLVGAPDETELTDLTFVGFAGMMDPPAEGVAETIERFRTAGIRTVMLTGDQRATAEAVARELAVLEADEETLDGRELGRLDERELAARAPGIGAFSRIGPEDKLRIVTAYQEAGEIVAMFGDGVNDAAALKKADVGVAMGIRGTDIAREVADVVLQDDRFPTLGAAVEEGRVIFDNIRKFVFYLFSCNVAEVFILLAAGVAALPLPLLPLQILWLNLVTDTFPALALALEPAEPDIMRRPPRDPGAALLSGRFVRALGFYAGLITISTLVAFLYALGSETGDYETAVTYAFMTLALAQIFHLGNARSPAPVLRPRAALRNRWALGAVVLAVSLQLVAIYFVPLADVLRVTRLGISDWMVIVPLSLVPAVVGQAIRWFRTRRA